MSKPEGTVRFHALTHIQLNERKRLKSFLSYLIHQEKHQLVSLDYIFCTDDYLLKINQEFLNHDELTDIISFDLSDQKGLIKGEIYISVDRIQENAKTLSPTLKQELHRVIFHGALHLCGYKDKTPEQAYEMRSKEDDYLEKYFAGLVPRGTKF